MGSEGSQLVPIRTDAEELLNHLEERLFDQAQAQASYTPLFWGCSRSIPQGMVSDVHPLFNHHFRTKNDPPMFFFGF